MFCSVLKNEEMNSSSNEIQQDLEKNVKKRKRSLVKGYHACKHFWTPVNGEHLISKLKPSNLVNKRGMNNSVDKYAVSTKTT